MYSLLLLWAELGPLRIHVLKFQPPEPQKVTLFEESVLRKVMTLK